VIINASNIKKIYTQQAADDLVILKNVSLEVQEGEVVAIVGPSGAGKSTLLHILGGLDDPTEGTVLLESEDIYRLKDVARAKIRNEKIGFVFQFYHLLPEFSVLENVLLPLKIKHSQQKVKGLEEKAKALLDRVGLSNRLTHKPYQLSGGEQQRVAIARSLANDPKIILCDEPTGNLDSENGQNVIDLLLGLNKENNQTLVIVTHDEQFAKNANRTIYMRDGNIS
jgi:lipoprotein-releasing system ATP-binding protein